MLQEQGRFAARIREQVWLLTCCCPFPFFYTSVVRWAVLSCVVEEKGNSTECGKTLYLFCLEWDGNLMSYWQYFLVSGGWKAGSLIWMLTCQRMWHPNPGGGVWDKSWVEVLETLGWDTRFTHVFWDLCVALKHVIEDVLDRLLYTEKPKLPSLLVKLAKCLVARSGCLTEQPGAIVFCKIKAFQKCYILWTCQHLKQAALSAAQAGLLLLLCITYYCCLFFC